MAATHSKQGVDRAYLNSVVRYIGCAPEGSARKPISTSQASGSHSDPLPRFVVHPLFGIECIDVTHKVVEAIARALWEARGGNDLLNWLEAERLFAQTMRNLPAHGDRQAQGRTRSAGPRHRSGKRQLRSHVRNLISAAQNATESLRES